MLGLKKTSLQLPCGEVLTPIASKPDVQARLIYGGTCNWHCATNFKSEEANLRLLELDAKIAYAGARGCLLEH